MVQPENINPASPELSHAPRSEMLHGDAGMINPLELVGKPIAYGRIAYHGVMAFMHDRRADHSSNVHGQMEQAIDFHDELGRTARAVVNVPIRNPLTGRFMPHTAAHMPPNPRTAGILDDMANSEADVHSNLTRFQATGRQAPVPSRAKAPVDPGISSGLPPETPAQRLAELDTARSARAIRHGRADQERRAKIFGDARMHSGWRTGARRLGMLVGRERAYRAGNITASELQDREREAAELSVGIPTHVQRHTAHTLHRQERRIQARAGQPRVQGLRARRSDRAERAATRNATKATDHRATAAAIRATL